MLPQESEPASEQLLAEQDAEPHMSSFILIAFGTEADRVRFENLLVGVAGLLWLYVGASAVTFCTSWFTRAPSYVDVISASVDLATVDVASAVMVLVGFTATHVYVLSETTAPTYVALLMFYAADLLVATVLSCLVGSLFLLSVHAFQVKDLVLTIAEGLTSLRVLDVWQAPSAPHSINVFGWLVMCMALPAVLLPGTLHMVRRLHAVGSIGIYFVVFLCLGGVLVVSLFASLREDSNVFYSNASNVGYRMVEFNVGVNMYYLVSCGEPMVVQLVHIANRLRGVVLAVFVFAWWAELGVPRTSAPRCVRLYHFNPCMHDHPGVLLRGCVLGACCVAWLFRPEAVTTVLAEPLQTAMNAASTVLLCTPVFCATKGILEVSFNADIVNANTALLSIILPPLATAVAYTYNLWVKPTVQGELFAMGSGAYKTVRRRFARRDSRPPPPASDDRAGDSQTFYPSMGS